MKFGPVPVAEAEGAILAHSVSTADGRLRKGVVLQAADVQALLQAGLNDVIVARLEPEDLDENAAAAQLAASLAPDPEAARLRVTDPFTGRVNLLAAGPGVVQLDVAALEAFNRINPMITIATVPPFQQMADGGMVATIKIISYAVPKTDVAMACAAAPSALHLLPPRLRSAGLIVTDIPGGPPHDKGVRVVANRLSALDVALAETRVVPHSAEALSQAIGEIEGELILILTGSATSDIDDVAPSAVRAAGGKVGRFGMPVDPGNLLFLGTLPHRTVIGLPGCARSPALNGADWVLSRVICGIDVSSEDIAGMGVGGLLKEIPTRPQPRAGRVRNPPS